MDAAVMCGGRGRRLGIDGEKPLLEIDGKAMVTRVLDALDASEVDTIHGAVSPQTPATRERLQRRGVSVIETPGEGYVADLERVLEETGTPLLTVAADLPLLSSAVVDDVLTGFDGGSVAVYIPAERKQSLGMSVDTTVETQDRVLAPTGVNIVGEGEERRRVCEAVSLAVNVNRPADAQIAEVLV